MSTVTKVALGCIGVTLLAVASCVGLGLWGARKAVDATASDWARLREVVESLRTDEGALALRRANPAFRSSDKDDAFLSWVHAWQPHLETPPPVAPALWSGNWRLSMTRNDGVSTTDVSWRTGAGDWLHARWVDKALTDFDVESPTGPVEPNPPAAAPTDASSPSKDTPRSTATAAAAGAVPLEGTRLVCRIRVPSDQAAPVYASMDPGAPIVFTIRNEVVADAISSATFQRDGQDYNYWLVETASGRGWIYDRFVTDVHEAPPEPARAQFQRIGEGESADDENGAHARASRTEMGNAPGPRAPAVLTVNADDPGGTVSLADHLVRGRYTVFDFTSEHCGPCRTLAPQLEGMAQVTGKFVLRKVQIDRPGARRIDWSSPVARQQGLSRIPYLVIYDPSGNVAAEGDEAIAFLNAL